MGSPTSSEEMERGFLGVKCVVRCVWVLTFSDGKCVVTFQEVFVEVTG